MLVVIGKLVNEAKAIKRVGGGRQEGGTRERPGSDRTVEGVRSGAGGDADRPGSDEDEVVVGVEVHEGMRGGGRVVG